MPGARLQSFRDGDVAEAFAGALLKRIAFVIPVPREEDVGHDFICAISERDGKLTKAGPSFAIQVKSNDKAIIYKKEHELKWIKNQENPFFVVISDIRNESLRVYTTWNMMKSWLYKGGDKIRLIPGEPKKGAANIQWKGAGPRLDVYLGKPILEFSSKDLFDDAKALSYATILKEWILLDRENIVRVASKMYWVTGPKRYKTNSSFRVFDLETQFYYNAKNLKDCQDNFVRDSTAILLVLSKYRGRLSNSTKGFTKDLLSLLLNYHVLSRPNMKLMNIIAKELGLKIKRIK